MEDIRPINLKTREMRRYSVWGWGVNQKVLHATVGRNKKCGQFTYVLKNTHSRAETKYENSQKKADFLSKKRIFCIFSTKNIDQICHVRKNQKHFV